MTKDDLIELKAAVDVLHKKLPVLIDWFELVEKSGGVQYDDERLNKVLEPSEFSVRAWSILKYYNISTLGELVSKRKRDIMAMRNLGKVTMSELEDYISKFGYQFK